MVCVLQYQCLDEAVPRGQLFKHSLQVGEMAMKIIDRLVRQNRALRQQAAWSAKRREKSEAAVQQLKGVNCQLKEELMAARCGKFS